jgi:hypothetical protein
MWGRTAAVAASLAADASTILTTPGNAACASATAKIQPRTNLETRPPTLSFPLVEKLDESNAAMLRTKIRNLPVLCLQQHDALDTPIVKPLLINTND